MAKIKIWMLAAAVLALVQDLAAGNVTVKKITNGNVYTVTQTDPAYMFDSARYTVFIPAGAEKVRGVFVHQHGCTMEGRGTATAYDVQYQALAKKWSLAVVGTDLYSAEGNCFHWKDPSSGSGDAFLKALEEIAAVSGHAELSGAPWLLWGHSGGGYWAQAMMRDHPEMVIALFSYSPGLSPDWDYPAAVAKIPVMIRHAGPVGDECCWGSAVSTYDRLRKIGGYAAIACNPDQNHNYSYVRYMAIPFYEAVLAQRLPPEASGALRDMDESRAWLGDTLTLNTYKASEYKGNRGDLCWLPDSIVASKWKEFSVTGSVADKTPPPAPYETVLKIVNNRMVELAWQADADIESGISHFNFYQGGRLIGRFPSCGDYQRFDTNGDDAFPVSTLPEMKAELTGIVIEDGKLSVAAVNHFGGESARTEFGQ